MSTIVDSHYQVWLDVADLLRVSQLCGGRCEGVFGSWVVSGVGVVVLSMLESLCEE